MKKERKNKRGAQIGLWFLPGWLSSFSERVSISLKGPVDFVTIAYNTDVILIMDVCNVNVKYMHNCCFFFLSLSKQH